MCCPEHNTDYQLPNGHTVATAVPEGCKDEECPCHCDHDCTSMCRHNGCNCLCGEFHHVCTTFYFDSEKDDEIPHYYCTECPKKKKVTPGGEYFMIDEVSTITPEMYDKITNIKIPPLKNNK